MRIYSTFRYTGRAQQWKVPAGVTEALFECWGASGGMSSTLVVNGRVGEIRSSAGQRNADFTNRNSAGLGRSYANGAGYAKGRKAVTAGDTYWIYVGGNGKPGRSAIRERANGTYGWSAYGGEGGWNGGGDGGKGSLIYQNLFNSNTTKVNYTQTGMPGAATVGQLWHDTDAHVVRRCKKTYSSGGSIGGNWVTVTDTHPYAVGPSGGGGGGATDIRMGGSDISQRILVAGGGGGAAGPWTRTGPDVWALSACPTTPTPPFGSDVLKATGPNSTWSSLTNYFSSGWGMGGVGGATGPGAGRQVTVNSGAATQGGNGGAATGRHKEGLATPSVAGSGGTGGTALRGGLGGKGGGVDGTQGTGGRGANASGGYDDWCAGGGGGGGGLYGGGGGGQGFKSGWDDGRETSTMGGGGGGGSNYASPILSDILLTGAARPPAASTSAPTGANGIGGFARITYSLPPKVSLVNPSAIAYVGEGYDLTFRYSPAVASGAKIKSYVVGTNADPNASTPTSVVTIAVRESETEFTYEFPTSPANGVTWAYFVKVIDTDDDESPWAKQRVRGRTAPAPAVITSPAAGSVFNDSALVTWTPGDQSPLIAYRLGLRGLDPHTGEVVDRRPEGWTPGGSRVNLAPDPGFKTAAVWVGKGGAITLVSQTTYPGASGSSGRINWSGVVVDAPTLLQETVPITGFIPGERYRMLLWLASETANDTRLNRVSIARPDGVSIASTMVDFSAQPAGGYVSVDMEFTPQDQSITVQVQPSNSDGDFGMADPAQFTYLANWMIELAAMPRAIFTEDFEDGSTARWAPFTGSGATLSISDEFYTGTKSAKVTAETGGSTSTRIWQADASRKACAPGQSVRVQVSASQLVGATLRSFQSAIVFFDAAGAQIGTAKTSTAQAFAALEDWRTASVTWGPAPAGTAKVAAQVIYTSAAGDEFAFDDITVSVGAPGSYFDGTNLAGHGGSVSWLGPVNASPSLLTGSDILSDTLTVKDIRLKDAVIYLDTLDDEAVAYGGAPSRATVSVLANPSLPATPTVELQVDRDAGLMRLLLDAADGAVSNKTVYFDIYRNGIRVAHRLIPDRVDRTAMFEDVPAHAEEASYVVRSFDSGGGYTDQSDGTVAYL